VYARTTLIQADPARLDEGIAHVRDQVLPAVTSMDGCIGMSMLVDRGTGRCIATTAWESEDAMSASAETVKPLRDEAAERLGTGISEVELWEVVVLHRDHAAPDGACARVTWLSGDTSIAERGAEMFRMAVLPRVEAMDGFCSASLMVNRDTGRACGTVAFESREHVERSRDAAKELREGVSRELGATVDEVAELDVALAHLHVPEMA
jgi:heme-degrading monooxygenase HmoA